MSDEQYLKNITTPVSEIEVGPYILCGKDKDSNVQYIYKGDWKNICYMLNSYLSRIMKPQFAVHTLEEMWVPYIQAFFKKAECLNGCFIMQDEDGNMYHAINGDRVVVAHSFIETLDTIYKMELGEEY